MPEARGPLLLGVGGRRVSTRALELLGIQAGRNVLQLSPALPFGLGDQKDVALTLTAITLSTRPASPGFSKEES